MTDTALPRADRRTAIALTLILCFSFVLGTVCVSQFKRSPFNELPIVDEASYVEWGKRVAAGDIVGDSIYYQDPLYPYFLGAVFKAAGANFILVRILQVIMGTLSVALVFFTARMLMGDRPALLAAAIMASYRGLYFFQLQLTKESLVILVSALTCFLGVFATGRPQRKGPWISLGLSFGLLVLLRGNCLGLIPFLLLWAFLYGRPGSHRERALRAASLGIGIIFVLMPVTVRNKWVGGEWVLTTSQAGANFYIGNNPLADGRYVTMPFVHLANPEGEAPGFKAEAERRTGRLLSPSEVSRFWYREALSWIRSHPSAALRLLLHKSRLMVHQFEIPDSHSLYVIRKEFVPAMYLAILGFGVLWGPAIAGSFILARQEARACFPAFFPVLYALSIIPFFIVDRYRLVAVPGMAISAAGFVIWTIQEIGHARWKRLLPAAIGILISVAIGILPTKESQKAPGREYQTVADAYLFIGNPSKSVAWYDRAIPLLRNPAEAIRNRGMAISQLQANH